MHSNLTEDVLHFLSRKHHQSLHMKGAALLRTKVTLSATKYKARPECRKCCDSNNLYKPILFLTSNDSIGIKRCNL